MTVYVYYTTVYVYYTTVYVCYTTVLRRIVQKKQNFLTVSSPCTKQGHLQRSQGTECRQQVALKRRQPPTVIHICAVVEAFNLVLFRF
jgi:hypothetical protein